MTFSRSFTRIYDTLPPELQREFVEQRLAPLLDTISAQKADRILSSVKRAQTQCDGIPDLDLRGKKREIQTLLRMLSKEEKIASSPETNNHEEILEEFLHTLSFWMNSIWSSVYEYKANYSLGHECLLFVLKSLSLLEDMPGECKCMFNNIPFTFALRDKQRRVVKYFSFVGYRNLEKVAFWVWRDLLLGMLAHVPNAEVSVKEMMLDIEEIVGWKSLESILDGGCGKRRTFLDDDADLDDSEDEEDMLSEFDAEGTDDEYNSDGDGETCFCCYTHAAKYWPNEMSEERGLLQKLIKQQLLEKFRSTPDVELFAGIYSVSQASTTETTKELRQIMDDIAGNSAETLHAVLVIYAKVENYQAINRLLEDYYHLLRLSDSPALLEAVAALVDTPCHPQAQKYVERELANLIRHIHSVVSSNFPQSVEEVNRNDLTGILKLTPNTPTRMSRIERWVDRCFTTTPTGPLNPATFAAMMMGLPVGPNATVDESELLTFGMDKSDPDFDEIRESRKPPLKIRFEAWYFLAQTFPKDNAHILYRTYVKVIESMPFFGSYEIMKVILNRLANRPSKAHVHDAMSALSSFCVAYRKKIKERRSKKAAASAAKVNKLTSMLSANSAGRKSSQDTSSNASATQGTSSNANAVQDPSSNASAAQGASSDVDPAASSSNFSPFPSKSS